LADDMREALVQRAGRMGQLLDCVVALETGEAGPASAIVDRAGELYLEALMWANSAAESLFGEAQPAQARAGAGRATAERRRAVNPAAPSVSTPPPLFDHAADGVAAPPRRPGLFARVWARCLALFGRRAGEARA
jgi:hypothetical protein